MIDDDRCHAEDVGGNLGGPCTCSACRARDEFLESEASKARARLEETMRAAINVEKTLDKNSNTCTVAISNLDETRVAVKKRIADAPRFVAVTLDTELSPGRSAMARLTAHFVGPIPLDLVNQILRIATRVEVDGAIVGADDDRLEPTAAAFEDLDDPPIDAATGVRLFEEELERLRKERAARADLERADRLERQQAAARARLEEVDRKAREVAAPGTAERVKRERDARPFGCSSDCRMPNCGGGCSQ